MTSPNGIVGNQAPLVAQVALRDGVRMDYRSHEGRLWSRMVDGPYVYSYPEGIKNRELLVIDGEDWHESLGPVLIEGPDQINWVETGLVYEGFGRSSRHGFMVSLLGGGDSNPTPVAEPADLQGNWRGRNRHPAIDVSKTMFREMVVVHSQEGYDVATEILRRNVQNLGETICTSLHDMRLSQLEPEEMRALAVLGRKQDVAGLGEAIEAFKTMAPMIGEMSRTYMKLPLRPARLKWMPSVQTGMHRYQRMLDFVLDRMEVVEDQYDRLPSGASELADLSI